MFSCMQSALALDLEAILELTKPAILQIERDKNNMKHLFIISLQLEADTYLNLFQGNIAMLIYQGIKDFI